MNLYHLKYFQDAAATGSVAGSAAANRVSPSAVSQAIRALEQELAVSLVRHARRRLELTEQGRRLAELGPEVFGAVQRLRDELTDPRRPPTGPLAFGISHSVATSLFGEVLAGFSASHPGIALTIKTGPTEQLKHLVRTGQADLAVFVEDGDTRDLEIRRLHSGRFVLAAARRASRRHDRPFLITELRSDVAQFLAAYRRRFGEDAGVSMKIESWEIIAHLAAAGLGIGLVPDFLLRGPLRTRLCTRELGLPEIRYDLCVALARQRPPGRNARLLLDALVRASAGSGAAPRRSG